MPSNNCIVHAEPTRIAGPGSVIKVITEVAIKRAGSEGREQFLAKPQELQLPNPLEGTREFILAANRIHAACTKGEKILLFGDYDCDGIISTVLLFELLRDHGVLDKIDKNFAWFIPHRQSHGYGLTLKASRCNLLSVKARFPWEGIERRESSRPSGFGGVKASGASLNAAKARRASAPKSSQGGPNLVTC